MDGSRHAHVTYWIKVHLKLSMLRLAVFSMPQRAENSDADESLRKIPKLELGKKAVGSNDPSSESISYKSKLPRNRFDPRRFDNDPETLRKPLLRARYANCITRKDIADRLQDGDNAVKPKGASESVKKWPPRKYNRNFRPPKLEKLPAPFSVAALPGLLDSLYKVMSIAAKEFLERPLNEDEMREWIDLEAHRLDSFSLHALKWRDYDDVAACIDKEMYKPLLDFFKGVITYHTDIDNIRGTTHSIEEERRDWVVLGLGTENVEPTCLVRLLQMTNLDVCKEIQDIALQSPFIKLAAGGQPQWPTSEYKTPQHGKARSVLEWVFHAARPDKSIFEGSCNFIKLTDGWNTIWFYVKNGVIFVGPTMIPHLTDITDDPGPNPSIGLVHAFLSCASQAGQDHITQNRIRLKSEDKNGVASGAVSAPSAAADGATGDTKLSANITKTESDVPIHTEVPTALKEDDSQGTTAQSVCGLPPAEAKRGEKRPMAGSSDPSSPVRKSARNRHNVYRLASNGSETVP